MTSHFAAKELSGLSATAASLSFWSTAGVQRLSHGELWSAVQSYVATIEAGTRRGDLILLVANTHAAAAAFFLAGIVAERVVSFFPPQHPIQDADYFREQQAEAFQRINPKRIAVFDESTRANLIAIVPDLAERILSIPPLTGEVANWRDAADRFASRIEGTTARDLPLFIQHSSGTTGLKKAVSIHAHQLAGQFEAYWRGSIVKATSCAVRVASWLPLYHDMGLVAAFLLPVIGGAPVSYIDPFEWVAQPQLLLDLIEADRSSVCWMPNFAFRHYVRLRRFLVPRDLSSVHLWINCSEPCRTQDAVDFETTFANWGVERESVIGCYAMAETVFAATTASRPGRLSLRVPLGELSIGSDFGEASLADCDAGHLSAGSRSHLVLSSGPPLAGVEIRTFVDGKPAPPATYGEIGIRAPFLFDGYRERSRAESGFLPDGTFMTGDLGAVVNGHLFVFGRTKEVIIVAGKNLYAGDVETAVGHVPGLKGGRVVAFGLDNDVTGSQDLIIVAERDPNGNAAAASAQVSELIHAMFLIKPRDVRVVEERWLVKSTSGKISRDVNRRKYASQFQNQAGV